MKQLKRQIINSFFLTLGFVFLCAGELLAQCAMCKASVETNVNEDGIGFAAKLNTGILYLFVTPYILFVVIALMWYKKSKERRQQIMEAQQRKERIAGL